MCFGSKHEVTDDPAPKPVRHIPASQPQDQQRDMKATNPYRRATAGDPAGAGGPSGQYAPPDGPPPGREQEQEQFAPPPGPPPSQQRRQDEYAPPAGPPPGRREDYAPPSGPPPGHQGEDASPPGPPPSHRRDDYAPPPGPPPAADWAAPPPGPPPSQSQPQHDWETAVPDTSLFPPPPAIFSGFEQSPASNAPEAEANAGEDWCARYPLVQPMALDAPARAALQSGNIRLIEPAGFNGKLTWLGPGRWEGSTARNSPDRCVVGYPPLYVAGEDDPSRTGRAKTVYYEVRLRRDSRRTSLGVGFAALPYPSFRMPGWHRGSLAVHGDDGHRYVNDRWGGKAFTDEFRKGDTYGVGMTLAPAEAGGGQPRVDVFFTRNGVRVGGWDLHEETDAEQDLPVTGLQGFHDLSCAIGTYDGVSFEVVFDPALWLYKGLQ